MDALKLLTRGTGLKIQRSKSQEHGVPSEGAGSLRSPGSGKKRKRSDDTESETAGVLTHEQIRQTQKQHSIRIVALQRIIRKASPGSFITRKRAKEDARLFPQPLTDFSQLRSRYHVSSALVSNIAKEAFYQPTEVQIASIPLLLGESENSPNLLTVAPTGSGKTLAFLLPLLEKLRLQHAQARKSSDKSRSVRAVILGSSKELVDQIVNEGRKLCVGTGVTITAMRKGMKLIPESQGVGSAASSDDEDESDQPGERQDLVKSDILVSTPLRLLHTITDGDETPSALPAIETLILDEADVLLNPQFREQTLSIWSALTSPHLHVSFWSATVGSSIEELAVSTIRQRQKRLGIKRHPEIVRVVIGLKDSSLPSISHSLIYAGTEPGKLLGLRQLLHPQRQNLPSSTAKSTQPPTLRPPFLVFTQTIDRATDLFQELQYDISAEAGGSSRIAVLHSSLSSSARSATMTKFRKGQIWILITTDLLSRGIDFKGINGVVNYDIPTTSAAYVHRAGRTGRAGKSGGICVTLWANEDIKYLKLIVSAILSSQKNVISGQAPKNIHGLPEWMVNSLPELSKKDHHELKHRGVESRRAIKESDDANQRRVKRKAKIGTNRGYVKQLKDRRKGAAEGSKWRKVQEAREATEQADEVWDGFD